MRKQRLNLSIVVPCATDVRIKKCIESIDENVEIVVVLNGASQEVKRIVKNLNVKIVNTKEANLSNALNLGIENSLNDKVIFIDSDCTFKKGAIKKVYQALKKNLIVKSRVVFQYNNVSSKIVADTRDYVNYNEPKPYNPFLAINKKIRKYSGGYYFDSQIHWTEDADFYSRLKKSDVKIKYLYSAKAYHPPLSFFQDLKSAFKYGIGKRIRVEKGRANGIGTHFGNITDLVNKKGVLSGAYYFIWNVLYSFGYFYQIIKDPYNVRDLYGKKTI